MSERLVVDWTLAERIAVALATLGEEQDRRTPDQRFGQAAIETACERAADQVAAYTTMRPTTDLPIPRAVGRDQWARSALRSVRELSGQLEEQLSAGLKLPGPLGSLARLLAGGAAGAEAGAAVGYASRRVLGQYDVALLGPPRPPELLLVTPNLEAAHAKLGETAELFLSWIALHETTHAVQFSAVSWLRAHLAGLISELIDSATRGLQLPGPGELARRLLNADPRQVVRTLLRGDLVRALVGPEQGRLLDAIQATMTMIEGHAEHVMDAVGTELDPGYARLRGRLEGRRDRGPLETIVSRLLGLELKLRQYRLGKRFCDAVVETAGMDGLNAAWAAPGALPRLDELEHPDRWLERVSTASVV